MRRGLFLCLMMFIQLFFVACTDDPTILETGNDINNEKDDNEDGYNNGDDFTLEIKKEANFVSVSWTYEPEVTPVIYKIEINEKLVKEIKSDDALNNTITENFENSLFVSGENRVQVFVIDNDQQVLAEGKRKLDL